ncbi:hypothetical protein K6119_07470 [Paracrocinitomix mangrovi]|uniref:FtsL-like putative cell division protein n=1 Tax=Paracrocinitomix mangrovi TaxID=2862509 RepID=UPI001C8DDCF8|nr:FtsL-like putative cell division protein [Paracrocinitomix mangrovi]UKN03353.1 hypothetical protein K6119_07470 [Paracrocinitomix mangrovi]
MSSNQYIDQDTVDELKVNDSSKKVAGKKKKSGTPRGRVIAQIMSGEFLTKDWFIKNLPFTFYVALLMVLLIGWGYYGETMTKKEVRLQEELGELNSEYYTLSSEYISKKGRRQIKVKLESSGLSESRTSPKKIRVKKYLFEE